MAGRLHRFDIFLTKDKSVSDNAQIPANAVAVEVYKQGAWAGEAKTISASASGTLAVRHPGRLAVGDTIQLNEASSPTATVDSIDSLIQITITAGGTDFIVALNDRLRVTGNRPTTYIESGGNTQTPTSFQADSNSLGHAFWYVDEESVDIRYSLDGSTFDFIYDHGGKPSNRFKSSEPNEANATAFEFDTSVELTEATARLAKFFNDGNLKFAFDKDGKLTESDVVPTAAIVDLAVTAAKLASDSVTAVKILDGVITAVKAAAAAFIEVTTGDGNTDFTIPQTTLTLIPGATVTATPAGTDSLFLIIAVIPAETVVANTVFTLMQIWNNTGSNSLHEGIGFIPSTQDQGSTSVLIATETSLTGAQTWQLRIKETTATDDGRILSSSTAKKARLVVIEIKNHT